MSIRIINGGMLTTVQDNGRIGYQQFGVPVSGAMDPQAAAIANILVGNEDNEAVLEVTMLGPRIEFQEANCIAVTGGDLTPARREILPDEPRGCSPEGAGALVCGSPFRLPRLYRICRRAGDSTGHGQPLDLPQGEDRRLGGAQAG